MEQEIVYTLLLLVGGFIVQNDALALGKPKSDLDEILQGVEEVWCGGCYPGMISVFGENASTIIAGYSYSQSHKNYIPFAAASRDGNGRIVAFAHTGRPLEDSNQITLNSILWAGQASDPSFTKVGVLGFAPLVDFLIENNFVAEKISETILGDLTTLNQYNVIVISSMHGIEMGENYVDTLKSYIKFGGGLVASCTPFTIGASFDWFGNRIIRDSGIAWIPMNMNANYNSTNFEISRELLSELRCPYAAEELIQIFNGTKKLHLSRISFLQQVVKFCLENVPFDYLPWFPTFKENVFMHTPSIPLKNVTDYHKAQVDLESHIRMFITEDQVPHASSELFPGIVDGSVESITFPDVRLRKGQKRYYTGLYAIPGKLIKVEVSGAKWFTIRIGCHQDHLTGKKEWARFPIISNKHQVNGTIGLFSSGFGGLIYIEDLKLQSENQTEFTIKIDGSIKTPSFILDQTSDTDWEKVRTIKAPFAEIIGKQVVLSIPGHVASSIDNPILLANFWDDVIKTISDLAGISYEENFQQFVFDLDISAGYMHSGFPIMAFLPSANVASNLSVLMFNTTVQNDDVWGLFHELGHNHQNGYYRFEEGGEVTCNIFAMYVLNILVGLPLADARPGLFSPENIQNHLKPYIENGCKYEDFIKSEGAKHLFYYQLVLCHGWDSYKTTFRAYKQLPQDELPGEKEYDKIRDKWLILFSQSSGYNIGPLMRSWGIPFSVEAEQEVINLPPSVCQITDLLV